MMDERKRREFDAGLSEEVDAWLRGDTSRREFLTRLMLMGGAAMLPGLGYTASGSKAWAAVPLIRAALRGDSRLCVPHTMVGPGPSVTSSAAWARLASSDVAPARPAPSVSRICRLAFSTIPVGTSS